MDMKSFWEDPAKLESLRPINDLLLMRWGNKNRVNDFQVKEENKLGEICNWCIACKPGHDFLEKVMRNLCAESKKWIIFNYRDGRTLKDFNKIWTPMRCE